MGYGRRVKSAILLELLLFLILASAWMQAGVQEKESAAANGSGFIKWVDFNVSYDALCRAYELDVASYGETVHMDWIELLAYTAASCGGEFQGSWKQVMEDAAEKLRQGECSMTELAADLKYYSYYLEAYQAVLGGYLGRQEPDGESAVSTESGGASDYGLLVYSPIAKGFPYNDYDDFGVSRSFGYKRRHLGHDMMGQIGTPVIAVESGYVEALGWNRYGGWRIGIRSEDKKRYYYYAHLRQNYPYAEWLKEGVWVEAGDVIGYMGHTGYSDTENVNNIDEVHLHFGIQLIFDESQKDGDTEIWINPYQLVRFLRKNQAAVKKIEGTKEWKHVQNN